MTATDALWGTLGVVTLTLPGWAVARAARLPCAVLAGFVAGAVVFTGLIVGLAAADVPLTFGHVGGSWVCVSVAAVLGAWRLQRSARPPFEPVSSRWREHWPLFLPLVPALAVVIFRASTQPLFGVDTIFRWNYLAEQMFARGTLDFYPPVTAAAYEIYGWPDGIAPLVSSLYFWLYSLAGATRPELTSPIVVVQYGLILMGVMALARRWFSTRAGAFAGALVASSPLIAWAAGMGQETGLTTLALIAMLFYLPRTRAEETSTAVVFSALAAGLGGLAREYGLVLLPLGAALCVFRRLSAKATGAFVAIACLAAVPWYVRNWLHTGNPLFDLSLGNVFPSNDVHAWLNAEYHAGHGWGHLPPEALRLFTVNGIVGIAGLLIGGLMWRRQATALIVSALVFVAAWIASVGYTAAGFIYSLRVLAPALVMGAILGGAALARWVPGQRGLVTATLCLGLFATDAALRALTLPANVYRIPPAEWLNAGRAVHDYHERPLYRSLARAIGQQRALVLGPNALLARQGARTVPFWSPDVRFVFDASLASEEIARRLRAIDIGFVLITRGEINERFLARSALFRQPAGALHGVWSDADLMMFRVASPTP